MYTLVLVIHVMLALALIGAVLLQRSEGGALSGLGGGGGASFGVMTGRSAANLLTRATAIIMVCFIGTSILLAVLTTRQRSADTILERPAAAPVEQIPAAPAQPAPPTR